MRQTLKLLWEYVRTVYVIWWVGVYTALVGVYDLATRFIPERLIALPPLSTEALWWLALPLLFLAPYPAFVQLRKRTDGLEKQLREQAEFNRQAAMAARLEMEMGADSRRTLENRLRLGEARLEELETEIYSGNFTHAGEVLALRKILLEVFSETTHGQGRLNAIKRVHDLVGAIESHQAEIMDSGKP